MPDGKRRVSLAIAVGSPEKPLGPLAGAYNGARDFSLWAEALGYESHLVTDEDKPLTVDVLKTKLQQALAPPDKPIHRLLLYFAGHGLLREAEVGLWFLSDWRSGAYCVTAEGLRRRLYYYGIRQVAVFTDACREVAATLELSDLMPHYVLGRGPKDLSEPSVDKFVAAQDGAKAYIVPGNTPERDRCIFTGVLLEALWGAKREAFSTVQPNKVTSGSLGEYLKMEVPRIAGLYKYTLKPSVSYSFPESDNVYFGADPPLRPPPAFDAWPEARSILRMGPVTALAGEAANAVASLWKDMFPSGDWAMRVPRAAAKRKKASRRLLIDMQQDRPDELPTGTGFAVDGGTVRTVWAPPRTAVAAATGEAWQVSGYGQNWLSDPASLLVQFDDGASAAIAALPNFIATVLRDARGVSAVVYRPNSAPSNVATSTEKAIAALEAGGLRADDLTNLAVGLRQEKHSDPVLGVVSAYLYDSIGDIDSIRRMAYYYTQHGQPIPYDIAMLAWLRGELRDGVLSVDVPPVLPRAPRTEDERPHAWTYEETPPVSRWPVGGLWPWLRQGWSFLESSSSLVLPGIAELTGHLTSARFTTIDGTGTVRLTALLGLRSAWSRPVATSQEPTAPTQNQPPAALAH